MKQITSEISDGPVQKPWRLTLDLLLDDARAYRHVLRRAGPAGAAAEPVVGNRHCASHESEVVDQAKSRHCEELMSAIASSHFDSYEA